MEALNEGSVARVSDDALSGARTPQVTTTKGNGSSRKMAKSSLPSPAVKSSKSQRLSTRPSKKSRKDRDLNSIKTDITVYKNTDWYQKAVIAGFKNKTALRAFNDKIVQIAQSIDPAATPVCSECGNSDLILCDHYIISRGVEEESGVILIPGDRHVRFRIRVIDNIRRMFTWPRFDPSADFNRQIGWTDPEELGDDFLQSQMLAYIRQHLNVSYDLNGVRDRKAKLAHAKKLAIRYLDEKKIKLDVRTNPKFVNVMHRTVQIATDMGDDDWLLQEQNLSVYRFLKAPSPRTVLLMSGIALPLLFPKTTLRSLNALQRMIISLYEQRVLVNARTLLLGSSPLLKSAIRTLAHTSIAIVGDIWNMTFQPCYTAIRQLLCNIVRTMYMRVCTSVISSKLQTVIPSSSIGMFSVV